MPPRFKINGIDGQSPDIGVAEAAIDAQEDHGSDWNRCDTQQSVKLVSLEHPGLLALSMNSEYFAAGPLERGSESDRLVDEFSIVGEFEHDTSLIDLVSNAYRPVSFGKVRTQHVEVGGSNVGEELRQSEDLGNPLAGGLVPFESAIGQFARFKQSFLGGQKGIQQISDGDAIPG
jgi:hypothetical protein